MDYNVQIKSQKKIISYQEGREMNIVVMIFFNIIVIIFLKIITVIMTVLNHLPLSMQKLFGLLRKY